MRSRSVCHSSQDLNDNFYIPGGRYIHPPWNLTHLKLAERQHELSRIRWASDAYSVFKFPREPHVEPVHPPWKINEIGNKLIRVASDSLIRTAAHSSYDVHRPNHHGPLPWAHNVYPRARNVVANCMSRSFQQ